MSILMHSVFSSSWVTTAEWLCPIPLTTSSLKKGLMQSSNFIMQICAEKNKELQKGKVQYLGNPQSLTDTVTLMHTWKIRSYPMILDFGKDQELMQYDIKPKKMYKISVCILPDIKMSSLWLFILFSITIILENNITNALCLDMMKYYFVENYLDFLSIIFSPIIS